MYKSIWKPIDIPKCNILSYLFPQNATLPEQPLWLDADNLSNHFSAAQMLIMIKRFATGLDKLGIGEQEVIMVFSPNHTLIPLIYLATMGSQRYFTGVNPGYTINEVAYQMKSVNPSLILVHDSLIETSIAAAKQANIATEKLFTLGTDKLPSWQSILAPEEESKSWQWDNLGEDAATTTAVINFSSGTTGLPKGVCITHYNLVANTAQAIFNHYEGREPTSERWLAFLPLYHAYSQLFTINIACKLNIPVYIMSKFAFEDFLKNIEQFKITTLQAVPPILIMMNKRPEISKYDISSLEYILCGAAPLSSDLQNDVMNKLNLTVCQAFGMSETTCAAIMTPGITKDLTGSIGYLLPNTDARLLDEDGRDVSDQQGELYLRGPQVMLKYWDNDSATLETKQDDWLRTGDIAIVKDGKFWVVDRKKELIKVNGLQVAPAELEAVLLEHEAVADAAVVGITIHGEELPRAYVVVQGGSFITPENLQGFVAQRVSKYKRLTGGIKFINEIPKFASGKIVRKAIREFAKKDSKELGDIVKSRL